MKITAAITLTLLLWIFNGSVQAQTQPYAPLKWWNVSNWYPPYNGPRYPTYESAFLSEWIERELPCGQSGSSREWRWDGANLIDVPGQGYTFQAGQAHYLLLECNGVPNGVPRQNYPSLAIPYVYCPQSAGKGPFVGGGSYFPTACPPSANQIIPDSNKGPTCPSQDGKNYSSCGDPINALVGNKYEKKVEYQGSGAFPLTFSWYYNSLGAPIASSSLPLGLGAMRVHNYSPSVSHAVSGSLSSAYITRPDGNMILFNRIGDGMWGSENPDAGVLSFTLNEQSQIASWTYLEKSGVTEEFDLNGRLISVSNQGGLKQELTYFDNGLLKTVRDPEGREINFSYNAQKLINRLNLPDSQYIDFSYDSGKNLASVTYPGGSSVGYRYNEAGYIASSTRAGALTGVIDEKNQRYSSTTYDNKTRATSTYLSDNVDKYTVDFSAEQAPVVTTPLGETRNLSVTPKNGKAQLSGLSRSCVGCVAASSSSTFDAAGRPDLFTDAAGVVTDTDYNARGLLTQRIESANQSETRRTTQIEWHLNFNVPVERRILNSANVLEARSTYKYNSRGQFTAMCQIDPDDTTAMAYVCGSATDPSLGVRQSATSYCEQADVASGDCPIIGLVKSLDGPRIGVSDITTYTYYQTDDATCAAAPTTCPHRKGDLWKITNAAGHVTEYTLYDGAGRALQMKDANGVVTDMEYNARGWLTARKVRGLDDTGEFYDDAITGIEYDPTGQVTRVTQPDGYLLGDYIDFTYDAAHRLTGIRDAMGNSITYTLDNAGNRTAETTKDPNGVVMRSLNRVFDTLGRLQASKNAADQTVVATTYDANDNIDISTDGLGRVSDQDVDPLNRLIKTIQDQGAGKINATTQFEYDARDNLTKVVDPKNLATTYDYNGLNDLTELSSPDTGNTTYTYDQAGNRKTQTDARNIVTTYSYDALNRLTQVAYPTASLNSHFTYDAINPICGPTETFARGHLTHFSDPSGNTQYCYDRFGNMTRKQTVNNGVSSTFVYAYTRAGRLSSLTYPSGMKVSYPRNKLGQVIEVVVTQGTTAKIFANNITYYPFGPLSRIEFLPPGSPNSNPYVVGPGAKLARSDAMHAAASGGGCTPRPGGGCNPVPATNPMVQTRVYDQDYAIQSVGGLNYQVDRLGNIESIVDSAGGNTFAYDHLDRLTNVRNSNTAADVSVFTYDPTGNRLTRQDAAATPKLYAYPTSSHRLGDVAGVSRQFDANGNTRQIGTNQFFTYDERNRMVDFRSSSSTIVRMYQYNAKGERVRKYKNVLTHASYLYDESGRLLSETKTNLLGIIVTQDIIWLDDMPIGLSQNGVLHGILTDHLNTPRQVFLTSTHAVQWRWDLVDNAFGDKPAVVSGVDLDLRFPGQLYDGESGLHYNYFRDYEPGTGRYIQADPLGLKAGLSLYSYVDSDPFANVDPLGLAKKKPKGDWVNCSTNEMRYCEAFCGTRGVKTCKRWYRDVTEITGQAPTRGPVATADPSCNCNEQNVCEQNPKTCAAGAAAGAGLFAYGAYRCARMLPSLLPPLWWTIPANAAIP
jgi:RHS repeat-associated protein